MAWKSKFIFAHYIQSNENKNNFIIIIKNISSQAVRPKTAGHYWPDATVGTILDVAVKRSVANLLKPKPPSHFRERGRQAKNLIRKLPPYNRLARILLLIKKQIFFHCPNKDPGPEAQVFKV